MQISRTPLSCPLLKKVYGTQPIGCAFNPVRSPHHPTASAFPFLYILCLRSCRLPSVFIRHPCLPSLPEELRNSWVPSLPASYPSSSLLQTLRHLLAFLPFPGLAGYRSDLLLILSIWDEEGFSSCLTCPCHRAAPTTPPECHVASVSPRHAMLPSSVGRRLGFRI